MAAYYYTTATATDGQAYTGSAMHGPITCGETGNITSIGVWCAEGGDGPGTIKVALYSNAATPALVNSGGSTSIPGEGSGAWVDITLGTPYAVTLNDVLRVAFQATVKVAVQGAATGGNYSGGTYASFPTSTLAMDTAELWRMRVYIEAASSQSNAPRVAHYNTFVCGD
jgi:hypothetical protein